jgi:hypothetical protein
MFMLLARTELAASTTIISKATDTSGETPLRFDDIAPNQLKTMKTAINLFRYKIKDKMQELS